MAELKKECLQIGCEEKELKAIVQDEMGGYICERHLAMWEDFQAKSKQFMQTNPKAYAKASQKGFKKAHNAARKRIKH